VGVPSSGGHGDVGYYNASTLALVAHTGALSTTSTGVQTSTMTAVTLNPGEYYECYTFDNTSAAFSGWNSPAGPAQGFFSNNNLVFFTAGNSGSGGMLPSTLTLGTANNQNVGFAEVWNIP